MRTAADTPIPRRTWLWVGAGYVFQAIPAAIRDESLPVALNNTGGADAMITKVVAALGLVFGVKILLAPVIAVFPPRRFIVTSQLIIATVLASLAWIVGSPEPAAWAILGGLMLISLLTAGHDYALDGYFVGALDDRQRAVQAGLLNFASKFGGVLCGPVLIWYAGHRMTGGDTPHQAWSLALFLAAGFALLAASLNALGFRGEPKMETEQQSVGERFRTMGAGLSDLLRDPRLWAILGLIFFYRASEIHMARILPLFSMRPVAEGGLGLGNETYALLRLWTAVGGLALGGVIGSQVVARLGLSRSLVPLGVAMHAPLLLITWLAFHNTQTLLVVGIVFFAEYLAYGAGLCALILAMMKVASGPAAPVRYAALSTCALLANYLPGLWAGALATRFGYSHYFLGALVLAIPGVLVSLRARRHFAAA